MGIAKNKEEALKKEQVEEAVGLLPALYIVPYLLVYDTLAYTRGKDYPLLASGSTFLYSLYQTLIIVAVYAVQGVFFMGALVWIFPFLALNYIVFMHNNAYLKYQRVLVKEKDTGWLVVATLGVLLVFALMAWLGVIIYARG